MAQQTAVEWLVNQAVSIDLGSGIRMKIPISQDIIEQAKQMEREQTIKFANDYIDDDDIRDLTAEEYYNENYGSGLQNETN